MGWKPFSLHFKQVYDGGYRYLDRCGELMLAAEDQLLLMPEDVSPSGCKMTLPETGISVTVGTSELAVAQEFAKDDGGEFLDLCEALERLVLEMFTPRHVESNGFASKSYWSMGSCDGAVAASLKLGVVSTSELAKDVEMPVRQTKVDCHFAAGSMDLHFQIHPVTFQSLTTQRHNAPALATSVHRRRVDRLNRRASRIDTSMSHGMMMELDLVEFDPPEKALRKHFDQLKKKELALQTRYAAI